MYFVLSPAGDLCEVIDVMVRGMRIEGYTEQKIADWLKQGHAICLADALVFLEENQFTLIELPSRPINRSRHRRLK